jgi:hypothetical protein
VRQVDRVGIFSSDSQRLEDLQRPRGIFPRSTISRARFAATAAITTRRHNRTAGAIETRRIELVVLQGIQATSVAAKFNLDEFWRWSTSTAVRPCPCAWRIANFLSILEFAMHTLLMAAREHAFLAGVNVSAAYAWWPVFRCPSMAGFGCPPRVGLAMFRRGKDL